MLLSAEQLSINFGSRQLLQNVDFYLNEGDKTGVIGINGTGKSTFLKVLAGLVQPDSGRISRRPNLQVSYLPQNPEMDDDRTILEQVFASMPPQFRALNEYEAKAMLTKLGLGETDRRIGTLSGGERRRAALCAALIHPADVLVLDEPTNHLDTEMVAWLEDWLRRYKGGLVMVTHDRYLMERVTDDQFALIDGHLRHCPRGVDEYLELLDERDAVRSGGRSFAEIAGQVSKEAPATATGADEAPKYSNQELREMKKRLASINRKMGTVGDKVKAKEAEMAAADPTDFVRLGELQAELNDLKAKKEAMEDEWLELAEALGVE